MIYLELFWGFLKIGLFSFGGGYAAMPLIQEQVVSTHNWLSMAEFTDLITISQMTPGPIAINSATFVGIKIAGIPGALASTAGCILPSCIIVLMIAKLYMKYRGMHMLQGILNSLRPAVVAMIASAGISVLYSALGKRGADLACGDQLDIGCDICAVCCAASEIQDEPDPCHGACGGGESGGIRSVVVGMCRMFGFSVKW